MILKIALVHFSRHELLGFAAPNDDIVVQSSQHENESISNGGSNGVKISAFFLVCGAVSRFGAPAARMGGPGALTPGYEAISKPIKQDMPRPGGFPPVRYRRDAAPKGPSGLAMFVGAAAIIGYGMYKVGQGNIARRELHEEKIQARRDIVAVLQAEEDRRWVKAKEAAVAREAEIMKDVPGWKAGENVYHGDRWMPPATQRHV